MHSCGHSVSLSLAGFARSSTLHVRRYPTNVSERNPFIIATLGHNADCTKARGSMPLDAVGEVFPPCFPLGEGKQGACGRAHLRQCGGRTSLSVRSRASAAARHKVR